MYDVGVNIAEYREACTFHDWLELRHFAHTHIVNEQPNQKRAIAEKKMGKSKGFPDYLIFLPNGKNVAVELKRFDKKAYASPEQKEWLARLARHGFNCAICHGASQAIEYVQSLLQ